MPDKSHCIVQQFCRLGLLGFGLLFISALARGEEPALPASSGAASDSSAPAKSAPVADPRQPTPSTQLAVPPGTMLPAGTPTTMPAAGTLDDYWIISSRNCKEKPGGCDTCCLEYYHHTPDRNLRQVGHEAFLGAVRPDVPVCFVVHGSYNWWRDVVTESRKINRWVRSTDPAAPLQVVFFTWPSDGNMPFLFPVDIAVLGRKSAAHSYYLARVISELPPGQPISMVGHSHGARATVAALHLLGGGANEEGQALPRGAAPPMHLQAVLIAAAIDHNWMNPGQRYSQALVVPERVLLMRNSRDTTLAIYPLRKGWGQRALGRDGFGTQDRMNLNDMQRKVVDLDAAQFAGSNHSFADYHEHPELASAVAPYVHVREEGPAAAPRQSTPRQAPYDAPEGDVIPIRPRSAPSMAQPAPSNPAAAKPASASSPPMEAPASSPVLPASTPPTGSPTIPLLTPPPLDEIAPATGAAPAERETVLKIMPRSKKVSHEQVRDEKPARAGEEAKPRPSRPARRGFDMWVD